MDAADLRPQPADGAERLAVPAPDGQAPDAQARDDSSRRWELRAAPAVAPASSELCTPVAARFVERSCGAPAAAKRPDAPPEEPRAERSRIQPEVLPQMDPAPQEEAPRDVRAVQPRATPQPATMLPEVPPPVAEQPEPPEFPSLALPALPLPASLALARPAAG